MPSHGQLGQLLGQSGGHLGRHDPRVSSGNKVGPTKGRKYKYATRDLAMAARKNRKNRARNQRRRHAKQHLTTIGKVAEARHISVRGTTNQKKKRNARRRFGKNIRRMKQQRRRRRQRSQQMWEELRQTTLKSQSTVTAITQPPQKDESHSTSSWKSLYGNILRRREELKDHPPQGQSDSDESLAQHWVAGGTVYG